MIKNRYIGRTFIEPTTIAPPARGEAEAEPPARHDPGQTADRGGRLDRARDDHAPARPGPPRGRGHRGPLCASPARPSSGRASTGSTCRRATSWSPRAATSRRSGSSSARTRLAHLSLDGLVAATEAPKNVFCRACFDGEYPVPVGTGYPRSSRSRRPMSRRPRRMSREQAPPRTGSRASTSTERPGGRADRRMVAAGAGRPEVAMGSAGSRASSRWRRPVPVRGDRRRGHEDRGRSAGGRFDTVGIDLVAMSANDVVCTGAEPSSS